ncbi:MAG TPA: hypothetical protein PKC76_07835 [Saprospiraceae bacterium]|nr:hypothetical protein [Saprospiraceae bacterium]HMP24024.1 hypothetical protein [Saprospiraceae bacterium]
MKPIILILLVLFGMLAGCAEKDMEIQQLTLKPIDSIEIKVDNEFRIDNTSGFFRADNDVYAIISGKNIYIVGLTEGVLQKDKISSEGTKPIKKRSAFDGIGVLPDGAFVYSNHFFGQIVKIGAEELELLHRIDDDAEAKRLFSSPFHKVVNARDYLLLPQFGNWRQPLTSISTFIAVNKEDLSVREVIPYTSKYDAAYWGDTPYPYWASIQYNE